jgi:hypothetical protein
VPRNRTVSMEVKVMFRPARGLTILPALALLATALFAFSAPAGAAETGTITIHSRLCPAGQPTTDIFANCHSHLPAILTSYTIDGGAAQAVGVNGNLSISLLVAGAHEIAQADGVPLDFAHLRVFCKDETAAGPTTEIAVNVQKFTVNAVAGHEVICDVYTIPENASGLTPTATAVSGGTTPTATASSTTLPNTGVGTGQSGTDRTLELDRAGRRGCGADCSPVRRIPDVGFLGSGIVRLKRVAANAATLFACRQRAKSDCDRRSGFTLVMIRSGRFHSDRHSASTTSFSVATQGAGPHRANDSHRRNCERSGKKLVGDARDLVNVVSGGRSALAELSHCEDGRDVA